MNTLITLAIIALIILLAPILLPIGLMFIGFIVLTVHEHWIAIITITAACVIGGIIGQSWSDL